MPSSKYAQKIKWAATKPWSINPWNPRHAHFSFHTISRLLQTVSHCLGVISLLRIHNNPEGRMWQYYQSLKTSRPKMCIFIQAFPESTVYLASLHITFHFVLNGKCKAFLIWTYHLLESFSFHGNILSLPCIVVLRLNYCYAEIFTGIYLLKPSNIIVI